jgi:C4-dicarboxylate-specific signal transduction histidine kinase
VAEVRLLTARQLVANIVHEISQPLSSIVNFSRACANVLREPTPNLQLLREWNEEMGQAAMRGAEMVQRMRRMVGTSCGNRQRIRAHEVIAEALVSAAPEHCPGPVKVQCRLCADDPWIEIDRGQVLQALDYLLRSTCESIARQSNADRQLTVATTVAGGRVEIVVASGDASELPREASVAEERRGGRACLVVCRMIVEAHGGTLGSADLRNGVAFLLTLPAVSAVADAVQS